MKALKGSIRKEIASRLKSLAPLSILSASSSISSRLFEETLFQRCTGLCIFLSMSDEVQTEEIIKRSFEMGKRVFIPKIAGKMPEDLLLYELSSFGEVATFPKSTWGIPEPVIENPDTYNDPLKSGVIDFVVVPGVAFDSACGRLGHGKGYYDCLLKRLGRVNEQKNLPGPSTIALAFDEQIIDHVPMSDDDRYIDSVLTPTRLFRRGGVEE